MTPPPLGATRVPDPDFGKSPTRNPPVRRASARGGTASGRAKSLALVAVVAVVAMWGCSSVVIKLASTTGLVASFYRLWLAIPLLWLAVAGAPSIRRRMNRDWLTACLVGGGLFGLHQLLFFNSVKLTSVANVTIIGALQPALVLVFAGRMFRERATLASIAWSFLALGGTILVVLGSAETRGWRPLGDALATGNLFAFTAYFLLSKRFRARVEVSGYVIGMTTVAGIVVLAACLATGQDLLAPTGWDWVIFLFLAILPGTLGHVLMNWAHRHTSAFVMSVMLLAVPVIASLGAVLFLDEALHPIQIAGGTIVLLAIGSIIRSTTAEAGEELAESAAATDAP
jgi:drug/metabolite transporter (DMT)-like permease